MLEKQNVVLIVVVTFPPRKWHPGDVVVVVSVANSLASYIYPWFPWNNLCACLVVGVFVFPPRILQPVVCMSREKLPNHGKTAMELCVHRNQEEEPHNNNKHLKCAHRADAITSDPHSHNPFHRRLVSPYTVEGVVLLESSHPWPDHLHSQDNFIGLSHVPWTQKKCHPI